METISRISSLLEAARDLTLEAAQSAGSSRSLRSHETSRTPSSAQIKKLLDSRNDREILDGLRKVISLMYQSDTCLQYFSAVVKNAASSNIEVKKLVYIYLLHHAEAEPDLALLSINAIQKSLTDTNPQVRVMALRTMSGIRVPVISQIVSLAIKRGVGDMSPHVRRAAALAIPKCYRLDPNTIPQLSEYLFTLLGDNQYFVVGPAVSAFLDVCPDRLDLIHKHYKSLVKKLVDMDEWSQLATLRLLTVYARKCFPRKMQMVKKNEAKGFYDDESSDETHEATNGDAPEEEVPVLDPDLELFLRACKLLLQSRTSAIIVSIVRCYLYVGTQEYLESAIGPLVALVRCPQDIQYVALYNIVAVAFQAPKLFVKYTSHFLVRAVDPPHIWRLKLEVLTILFPHLGMHYRGIILSELEHFSQGTDPDLVRESVRAIGRCAQTDSKTSSYCLRLLLSRISSIDDNVVSESLTIIRHLIQQNPNAHKQTIVRLASYLETTANSGARASIIWLVGEYAAADLENSIAPDVLRILAKGFADETEEVKQQIVLLAAKVYLHHLLQNPPPEKSPQLEENNQNQSQDNDDNAWAADQTQNGYENPTSGCDSQMHNGEPSAEDRITLLWRYILLLTRYDTSYDLRDRARMYRGLLSDPKNTQMASLLLLAPKPAPHAPSPSETRRDILIGTSTLVVGPDAGPLGLTGYEPLPDWVTAGQEPDRSLREDGSAVESSTSRDLSALTAGQRLDKALQEHETSAASGAARKARIGAVGSSSMGTKSLNDWLDEEEEEGEEETSEDESGSTEYETDSEEETESEEDDDEEEDESDSEAAQKRGLLNR
ncbi:AP-3 adaptor complex subunit beta, putative [Talaromyces stipitatus ATCC 10500]|uniref:AP-3 adaptor complex subunit beta, putative n=1 Tax=Talaromyces stipitatus (strain ATCC 10500 / CBS 375.48 / QM 6759 / NRRL 1006) TaxID=441959 RepID=B8LTE6_TALSN|nr:AP-3 adaptor complex subunit beta, putative [Talaromyces stipitatus ATCC 10500]EED23024.1 AP-3 adaptor complex subunit beta, putative [Talaromyces stipitatus ATCC 10500]